MSFLSGKDETELAELDRALGIDKLVQVASDIFGGVLGLVDDYVCGQMLRPNDGCKGGLPTSGVAYQMWMGTKEHIRFKEDT